MENKEVIQEAIELLEKAIAEFWTDEGFTWNAESEYMDNEQKRAFEAKNVRSVIR